MGIKHCPGSKIYEQKIHAPRKKVGIKEFRARYLRRLQRIVIITSVIAAYWTTQG